MVGHGIAGVNDADAWCGRGDDGARPLAVQPPRLHRARGWGAERPVRHAIFMGGVELAEIPRVLFRTRYRMIFSISAQCTDSLENWHEVSLAPSVMPVPSARNATLRPISMITHGRARSAPITMRTTCLGERLIRKDAEANKYESDR